jgi:hypothetical protein
MSYGIEGMIAKMLEKKTLAKFFRRLLMVQIVCIVICVFAAIVAVSAIGVGVRYYLGHRAEVVKIAAADEVGRIVQKTYETRQIGADLSPELRKVIKGDPQYVLVALTIEEAKRGWPGISADDANRITDKAIRNSEVALEDLQKVLRQNAQQKIADAGHRPDENWDNNNTATAILFCYWPKAVEKGRQSQFVEEYLCGARDSWTSWMFN